MLTLTASSFVLTNSTITDISYHSSNDWAICADSGNSGRILAFNLTDATLAASGACLTSSVQSVLVVAGGASAVVAYSSGTSVSLFELPSFYRTDHTTATTLNSSTIGGKKGAYNHDSGICLWGTSTSPGSRVLMKFDTNTRTVSTFTLNIGYAYVRTLTYIGNNRFLIGTSEGAIFEIDDSGTIYAGANLQIPFFDTGTYTNSIPEPEITSIIPDGNLLMVMTNQGSTHIWDWSTKRELDLIKTHNSSSPLYISNSASGVCIIARDKDQSSSGAWSGLNEVDLSICPFRVRATAFNNDFRGYAGGVVINPSTGRWATIMDSTSVRLLVGTIIPRDSVVQTLTSPGDVDVEVIIINDTDGEVSLNTYMKSPGDYRLPAGKDIIEIIKSGEGTTALWSVRNYAT